MKANELAIGNWYRRRIIYKDTGREVVTDFQITQICKNGENLYVYGPKGNMGRVDQIEPIPLTAEILEKNGFQASEYGRLVFETDEYYFALQKGVDGINNWWWELFCSPIIPINYVHELQHALRLCGIEKEIIL